MECQPPRGPKAKASREHVVLIPALPESFIEAMNAAITRLGLEGVLIDQLALDQGALADERTQAQRERVQRGIS